MSDEKTDQKRPSPISRPAQRFTSRTPQPERPFRPDFEYNLAEFELEFFEFVAQTDPSFDLDLLRNNPNPPVAPASPDRVSEAMHPATKEELGLPLHLSGPRVVNGDIFGDQVVLEGEVRVKGCVYGRASVQIGTSCVIEGSVVSNGPLLVKAGSRIEGAVIGQTVKLNGPVQVEGPVYSRQDLSTQGRLEAQILYANDGITLGGNPTSDEIRIEAGLIMSRTGEIESQVPVWLAEVEAQPAQQKFYLKRGVDGLLNLIRATTASLEAGSGQSTILTTLTDAELEKLVSELIGSEN